MLEKHRLAVAAFFMVIMQSAMMYQWYRRKRGRRRARSLPAPKIPYPIRNAHRELTFGRLFRNNDLVCYDNLRMRRGSFNLLCDKLRSYGLCDSRFISVEEQVAMFLLTVGHDWRNRSSVLLLWRSGETVSKYFHMVLGALLKLYKDVVQPPTSQNSPKDGGHDSDWHHYFEDAIGAIDGTHFPVNVPLADQPRYRNRKQTISQNVLVAVTFDMKFRYVLAGWEGSAHDGRVLRCAVSRDGRRLTIPQGKYYLADAGYANVTGFLTPYRSVQYHLKDIEGRTPENAKELYNFRHSSLRNVVERTIGVLKKRFAYLRNGTFHDVETQAKIVLACCAMHNFLRDIDPEDEGRHPDDTREEEEEEEEEEDEDEEQNVDYPYLNIASTPEWTHKRDSLKDRMWEDYLAD
ncbi:hypothetical protein ACHQM5_015018 [Ranunculus cassubicifolius]